METTLHRLLAILFAIVLALPGAALASTITGLDFPESNAETIQFRFANPQANGLPIYGEGGAGVTYIWNINVRQKSGYYTTFFWGGTTTFDGTRYYGAHPYPYPELSSTTHQWEIAVNGHDVLNGTVVYGTWYTQALRVWAGVDGKKYHEFYWNLPNTDSSHLVEYTAPASYGNTNPPSPALTWGDAPWSPTNEMHYGIIRGIRIYNSLLSVADMLSEATTPLSTTSGAAGIWYLNMNPTPTDISDKSGKGHNPAWFGAGRPSLYSATVGGGGKIPSVPGNVSVQ